MVDRFEDRLRKIRLDAGHSRKTMAEILDISDSSYARYEYGKISPTESFLAKLRRKFDVNVHWLVTGEGEPYIKKYKGLPVFLEAKKRVTDEGGQYGLSGQGGLEAENAELRAKIEQLTRALSALAEGEAVFRAPSGSELAQVIVHLQKAIHILQEMFMNLQKQDGDS